MTVINGKDVILYVLDSAGIYQVIGCARDCTLTTDTDLAETSTVGTGTWKTYKGLRNSWSVATDGLITFDTGIQITTLRAGQFAFTNYFLSFTATDKNGLTATYQGYAIIKNVSTTGPYNDLYTYTIEFTGNGELKITDTPVDPNQITGGIMVYQYDATGNETNGATLPGISTLSGKKIDLLFRDGVEYRKITAGVPAGKQFKIDAADPGAPVIIFAADVPPLQPGEMIDIPYQNQ